jgi:hypothetical protein
MHSISHHSVRQLTTHTSGKSGLGFLFEICASKAYAWEAVKYV